MSLIDKNIRIPLYQQIYEAYKKQILSGSLECGARLPATRKLASDLAVGRNTVEYAYQQLEMEGYVTARVGSGYTVNDLSLMDGGWQEKPERIPLREREKPKAVKYDFGSGRASTLLFPVKAWKKCLSESLYEESQSHSYFYPMLQGEYPLRKAIADYLFSARGIECSPDHIVITSGLEFSIERLLDLFAGEVPCVAMENPGYHSARIAFQRHGCSVIPVAVDHDGIDTEAVGKSGANLLYITPSHQFPTGAVLSIKRRIEAIEWAEKNDAYIIEDDYDSELRYNAKPAPPLCSMDRNHRTIYLGTFSKSFSPSIRVGFMILPELLMEQYMERYRHLHNSVPTTIQNALAKFISTGNYSRHIDRLRVSNKKKNARLVSELNRVFHDRVFITGAGAGQHILADITSSLCEQELLDTAYAAGIKLHAASKYWMAPCDAHPHQIMMGYGGIVLDDIAPAIELLYKVWFG